MLQPLARQQQRSSQPAALRGNEEEAAQDDVFTPEQLLSHAAQSQAVPVARTQHPQTYRVNCLLRGSPSPVKSQCTSSSCLPPPPAPSTPRPPTEDGSPRQQRPCCIPPPLPGRSPRAHRPHRGTRVPAAAGHAPPARCLGAACELLPRDACRASGTGSHKGHHSP